jgi:hypothetical protein
MIEKLSLAVIAGIAGFFAAPFLLAFFTRTGERVTYQLLISAAFAGFGGILIFCGVFFAAFENASGGKIENADMNAAAALAVISLFLALGKLASVWSRERKGDFIYSSSIGVPRFPIFWAVAGPRADDVFRVGAVGSVLVLVAGIAVMPVWPAFGSSLCVIWFFSNVYLLVQFLRFRLTVLELRDASLFTEMIQEAAAGPHKDVPGLAGLSDETAALLALYSYSKHNK